MLPSEQAQHVPASLHVVPGEDERGGLARGQETAVRQSLPAAELGVLPVEVLVLHEEDIQCLRADMGHEGEHHHDPFLETDVRLSRYLFQPPVMGRLNIFNAFQFASLPEIELDGSGQHLAEPPDMFTHHL